MTSPGGGKFTMAKYKVTIYEEHIFEVEANDKEEADIVLKLIDEYTKEES